MRNHVPDMYDVKEGVKSVARKLSHYAGKLQEALEVRFVCLYRYRGVNLVFTSWFYVVDFYLTKLPDNFY